MLYNLCLSGIPSCELRTQPAAGFVHIALVGFVPLFFRPPPRGLSLTHIIGESFLFSLVSSPHSLFHHHHRGLFNLNLVSLLFHSHLYYFYILS